VADRPGLRPSGDRSRETLFNWLGPGLAGSRCLDAFAGTGALGLEAASRGAGEVVLIERDRRAAGVLRETVSTLQSDPVECRIRVHSSDSLKWMPASTESFDLIFIDPPFNTDLACRALDSIRDNELLAAGGRVYLETGLREPDPLAGRESDWEIERDKVMGEVKMRVLRPAPSPV